MCLFSIFNASIDLLNLARPRSKVPAKSSTSALKELHFVHFMLHMHKDRLLQLYKTDAELPLLFQHLGYACNLFFWCAYHRTKFHVWYSHSDEGLKLAEGTSLTTQDSTRCFLFLYCSVIFLTILKYCSAAPRQASRAPPHCTRHARTIIWTK